MNALSAVFAPLSRHPWVALVIGVALALIASRARRFSTGIVAVVWLLYGLYEMSIRFHVICRGGCDIRVDLLIIYPALVCISLFGLMPLSVSVWRHCRLR